MSEKFTPLLTSTDWNEEWKQLQAFRRHTDDASYWDKRSKTFTAKDSPNPYVQRFLELADIKPGETVFDMGCGTGAISLPLGEQGHKVVAADFSDGMLDVLKEELTARNIKTIFPKCMSWEDNWDDFGVREGMTDIAVASRSIATVDLKDSLLRLTAIARRRVCITLSTGSSPRIDENLFRDIGIDQVLGHDYLYAFNILVNEGIKPEISYISSERKETFDGFDEAYTYYGKMIQKATTELSDTERNEALAKLDQWLHEHLIKNPYTDDTDIKGETQRGYCLKKPRVISWAFISWNK